MGDRDKGREIEAKGCMSQILDIQPWKFGEGGNGREVMGR